MLEQHLQWTCLGPSIAVASTNGPTNGLICRGGWYYCLIYRDGYYHLSLLWPFVGAAESPATPINDRCIYKAVTFFLLGSLSPTREKKIGRSWAPPKHCSTKGGGFYLKYFGEEILEGKKILF